MSLILLFNSFENNLKRFCIVLGKSINPPIDYSKLKGDEIVKCQNFLMDFCGVKEEIFKTDVWKKIDCIRRIRNSFVHNDSDISLILKKNKKIINEFKKVEGFSILDTHLCLLKSNFLRTILEIINTFHDILIVELKKNPKFKTLST